MATEDENQRLQDECRRLAGELVELQRAKQVGPGVILQAT